jgi:hypothetical protein
MTVSVTTFSYEVENKILSEITTEMKNWFRLVAEFQKTFIIPYKRFKPHEKSPFYRKRSFESLLPTVPRRPFKFEIITFNCKKAFPS